MHQAGNRKRRVALVDLNDNESGLILQYHHHPEWEVVALCSADDSVWPVRLARSCGVPVIGAIGEVLPLGCDRIVIGARSASLHEQLTSVLSAAGTEVCGPVRPDVSPDSPDTESPDDTMERAPIVSVVPEPPAFPADLEPHETAAGDFDEPPAGPGNDFPAPEAPLEGSTPEMIMLPPRPVEVTIETDDADGPVESTVGPAGADPAWNAPAMPPPLKLAETPAVAGPPWDETNREESHDDVSDDLWEHLGEVRINPSRGDLFSFLRTACQRMKATSASLALPEPDHEAVRLVAWYGLPPELVANPRKSLGCAAGRVITGQGPQITHATPLMLAEDDSPPVEQTFLSLPVQSRGRTLAALSFAIPRRLELDLADLPRPMRELMNEAEFQLLKAVDTDSYDWNQRREILLHGADRAMSLDDSLPERLRAIGDILTLFVRGSVCHLYLTDTLGEKLQLISPSVGPGSLSTRFQDAQSGLVGWVLRTKSPCLFLPAADDPVDRLDRQGLLMLPFSTEHRAVALLVVEGVHIPVGEEGEARRALADLSRLMEEMLMVEQGIGDQDLYQQLRLRFREVLPMLEGRAPLERAQMALDAAVETLAAEAAIWLSPRFNAPVLPSRLHESAFPALARIWPELDRVAGFVRENGRAWSLPGEPTVGPELTQPYVGVAETERDGVLFVLFDAASLTAMGPQLTVSTIAEMLHNIGEQVEDPPAVTDDSSGGRPTLSGPGMILAAEDLRGRVVEEWIRSVRFGHGFSVSRISVPDTEEGRGLAGALHDFLGKVQRNVNFLSEIQPGQFCLLSPETERFPEGLQFRLQATWKAEHGDVPLRIEQRIYPRDGQGRKPYVNFINDMA